MIGLLAFLIFLLIMFLFWRAVVKPRTEPGSLQPRESVLVGSHTGAPHSPFLPRGFLPMESFGPCRCAACLKLRTEPLEDNHAVREAEMELAEAWHRVKTEVKPNRNGPGVIAKCVLCGRYKSYCVCPVPRSGRLL